jgi:hypothetical protein
MLRKRKKMAENKLFCPKKPLNNSIKQENLLWPTKKRVYIQPFDGKGKNKDMKKGL